MLALSFGEMYSGRQLQTVLGIRGNDDGTYVWWVWLCWKVNDFPYLIIAESDSGGGGGGNRNETN